MIGFEWPWVICLLPLPWLVRRWLPPTPQRQGPVLRCPHVARIVKAQAQTTTAPVRLTTHHLEKALLTLVWCSLVLALMRPYTQRQIHATEQFGYDLFLAVDLSQSMAALDFSDGGKRRTRLQAAQQVVSKFVQQRQQDRVGLIVFADRAYTYVPLTYNTVTVSRMLNDLSLGMAGPATAIGDAIAIAVKNLKQQPKQSRVLILLTDGADTASHIPPLQAAKRAAAAGVKIHTIGMGSKQGVVPLLGPGGQVYQAQVDLDEGLLRDISKLTGGKYAIAHNNKQLEEIYRSIDALEKTKHDTQYYTTARSWHRPPLLFGLILGLVCSGCAVLRRYYGLA